MSALKNVPVEEARARLLDGVRPGPPERAALAQALGRVLAEPIVARRDQPPFFASAMDGYAALKSDLQWASATLRVVGESSAGRPWSEPLQPGQAVRIFTGAPVPFEAWVVPQEDVERAGEVVRIGSRENQPGHVRNRGADFAAGAVLLNPGMRLDPWRLSLAAAAGYGELAVNARPRLAILSTGEEIVAAGRDAGPYQIYDSGSPALAARAGQWGAAAFALAPEGDDEGAIAEAVRQAQADIVVTVGGASVGDYDLVKPALRRLGLELIYETVRLRPGKPTWAGRLGDGRYVVGLPGNPTSALVCAELFLRPLALAWQGADPALPMRHARLTAPLPAAGPRAQWMRASLASAHDGGLEATPFRDQDSSLVSVFAQADALLRRPEGAPAVEAGTVVEVLPLERL